MRLKIGAVIVAAAAMALPSLPATALTTGAVEQHCVARVFPQAAMKAPEIIRCFDSFAASVYFSTRGAVRLDPSASRSEQIAKLDEAAAGLPPVPVPVAVGELDALGDDNVRIGIDFSDYHYEGSTLTWMAASGCSSTVHWAWPAMPTGWNDVVSSARAYSGCTAWLHYQDNSYTGDVATCTCYYIGDAMNDQTSSEEWYSS